MCLFIFIKWFLFKIQILFHLILFLGSLTSSYSNLLISDIFLSPRSFFLSLISLIFVMRSSSCSEESILKRESLLVAGIYELVFFSFWAKLMM